MPNNIIIPFTEAWERAKLIVGDRRVDSDTERLYKNLCNIIYTQAIPQVLEFDFLRKEVSTPILVNSSYSTGTVTVADASATVTGASTTFPTAAGVGWKLKISGDDNIYEVLTRDSATQLTLKRTYKGTLTSGNSYILYQDLMSLASDFDRFTTNPRIWYRDSGTVQYIDFKEDGLFLEAQITNSNQPRFFRLSPSKDASDNYQIQFDGPFDADTLIYYEYIPALTELTEYVTGTVAVTNNSTTVTGTGTVWSTNVVAGDYFRIDNDSRWFKISSVGSDTGIVLASVYKGSTVTGAAYTASQVFTKIPEVYQNAIIYGIAALAASHQDDEAGYSRWLKLSGIPEGVLGSLARAENRVNYGKQRMRTVYQSTGVRR